MIRRCYYKHDWLHKHLGTGIHLNLRRLQGKFHIKWKEPYIFCRSKRKGHVASKTAHVLTLRIKQILSHLHVIYISTDNEIWSSSLHQGNRKNRENLLQRMTFKSTLLATVKSNDVYDWTSWSSCDNVFKKGSSIGKEWEKKLTSDHPSSKSADETFAFDSVHSCWLNFPTNFMNVLPIQTGLSGTCGPQAATNPVVHSHLYEPAVLLQV